MNRGVRTLGEPRTTALDARVSRPCPPHSNGWCVRVKLEVEPWRQHSRSSRRRDRVDDRRGLGHVLSEIGIAGSAAQLVAAPSRPGCDGGGLRHGRAEGERLRRDLAGDGGRRRDGPRARVALGRLRAPAAARASSATLRGRLRDALARSGDWPDDPSAIALAAPWSCSRPLATCTIGYCTRAACCSRHPPRDQLSTCRRFLPDFLAAPSSASPPICASSAQARLDQTLADVARCNRSTSSASSTTGSSSWPRASTKRTW